MDIDADVVRARQLQIIDEDGQRRAEIGTDPEAGTYFWLLDDSDKVRVGVLLHKGAPTVSLCNSDGIPQLRLALQSEDRVGLVISDSTGMNRATLSLDHTDPGLMLLDWDGNPSLMISLRSLKGEILVREAGGWKSLYPPPPDPPTE